ncbi:hypothetical protein K9O30_07685 [Clostridium bowmanii]|uniref:hypothetical protein n=1 Tax=Clostridium bowmanii TaxID=132925 RepID=UPI001C0BAB31|nr:hypothetical protein [Clostridium bowmanii]MBU3189547.1 hypothetical protein [Clostridium bowmanii]MCA1073610.1 hypothetical protein [Clostridium bowmanii]
MKNGLSEDEIIIRAKNHGVIVNAVSTFWMRLEKYSNNMIMLGFGEISENDIAEGIKILNNAWFT